MCVLSCLVLVISFLLCGTLAATPYSPVSVQCPPETIVRKADSLSDKESDWISHRDAVTQAALVRWLEDSGLKNFDVQNFFDSSDTTGPATIRTGLAFSGGGYRAMLSGAGMLAALDSRTRGPPTGSLSGLLQAASYMTGLSGGAWLVGSVAMNNFATIPSLQASKDLWNFQNVFNPTPTHSGFLGRLPIGWTVQAVADVLGKESSGYPISLTDVWGRYLSAQTLEGTNHGQGLLWSELAFMPAVSDYQMPLPILVFDSVVDSFKADVSLNSTIYEASPFDFGSWDPTVYSFVNTQYLGSPLSKGIPGPDNKCVIGYDNVGFLIGASSTLFNQFVQTALQASDILRSLFNEITKRLSDFDVDLAIIANNPFADIGYIWKPIETANSLMLVDGGEDGQNIPLTPLLQPDRQVDVVLAFDNSADDSRNWPMGDSLVSTYLRQFGPQGNGTSFPYVPDVNAFAKYGLIEQPVFFGCTTSDSDQQAPLVIYVANSKHSYASNFSTFKLSYNSTERDSMITNGYNIVTQNNGTLDNEWRSCVACSLILREQQRRGQEPSPQCSKCFSRYCYEKIVSRMNRLQPQRDSKLSRHFDGESGIAYRRDGQSNVIESAQNLATDRDGLYEEVINTSN